MNTQGIGKTKLGELTANINFYHQLQEEKKRIEMSMEIARKAIVDAFTYTGMREYLTPDGIKAWVETRARTYISPKEAEALLDPDTYRKLAKESVSVVLTVRQLKEEGK